MAVCERVHALTVLFDIFRFILSGTFGKKEEMLIASVPPDRKPNVLSVISFRESSCKYRKKKGRKNYLDSNNSANNKPGFICLWPELNTDFIIVKVWFSPESQLLFIHTPVTTLTVMNYPLSFKKTKGRHFDYIIYTLSKPYSYSYTHRTLLNTVLDLS